MLLDRGLLTREGNVYRATGAVEDLEVPETLHALVAARLDSLPPEERRLVECGAVLGKTFTKHGLTAVSGVVKATATVGAGGSIVTVATATGMTVTVAVACLPSMLAVISLTPRASAWTVPSASTLATAGVPLCHDACLPAMAAKVLSTAVAWRCPELPSSRDIAWGVTSVASTTGAPDTSSPVQHARAERVPAAARASSTARTRRHERSSDSVLREAGGAPG